MKIDRDKSIGPHPNIFCLRLDHFEQRRGRDVIMDLAGRIGGPQADGIHTRIQV